MSSIRRILRANTEDKPAEAASSTRTVIRRVTGRVSIADQDEKSEEKTVVDSSDKKKTVSRSIFSNDDDDVVSRPSARQVDDAPKRRGRPKGSTNKNSTVSKTKKKKDDDEDEDSDDDDSDDDDDDDDDSDDSDESSEDEFEDILADSDDDRKKKRGDDDYESSSDSSSSSSDSDSEDNDENDHDEDDSAWDDIPSEINIEFPALLSIDKYKENEEKYKPYYVFVFKSRLYKRDANFPRIYKHNMGITQKLMGSKASQIIPATLSEMRDFLKKMGRSNVDHIIDIVASGGNIDDEDSDEEEGEMNPNTGEAIKNFFASPEWAKATELRKLIDEKLEKKIIDDETFNSTKVLRDTLIEIAKYIGGDLTGKKTKDAIDDEILRVIKSRY